jgi:voltage-gated sodium channel
MLARILENPLTERVILALILFNAITLGLETSPAVMERYGTLLLTADRLVLAVFVVEILARMAVHRLSFFRDPWSLFDAVVVGVALVPAAGWASILRALRVLRVLRLITVLPSLKKVVGALVTALPGMGAITLLLFLIFYVFSVMATHLFGASSPEQFGSLGSSAYTLFQVMTFDDWSAGVVRPLMEEHPYAIVFFLTFILFSTFVALNLFIGIIVTAIDSETKENAPKLMHPSHDSGVLLAELRALRAEVAALATSSERRVVRR